MRVFFSWFGVVENSRRIGWQKAYSGFIVVLGLVEGWVSVGLG